MTDEQAATSGDLLKGLNGQRVLITAGGGGIGYAIAQTLHAQGARIAVCDISEAALAEAKIRFPMFETMVADVSRDADVDRMFDIIADRFGGLDALVNNAGITGPTGGVDEIDPDEWRRCLDICLTGQFLCARRAVPMLRQAGGGSIVNMSSAAGRHGYALRSPYSSAKFGVIGFTQSLAKELGPQRIRVNAILPGIVEGPRMDGVIRDRAQQMGVSHEEMTRKYVENISLRRMVSPYDVAAMVAFLLSDAGANVSGQSLAVDGNVETL